MTRRGRARRPAWIRYPWLFPVTLAVLVVIAMVVAQAGTCGPESPAPGDGTVPSAIDGGGSAVSLVSVVDGDTIWVSMPDGSEEKVRYIGIDAPEIPHPDSPGENLGEEASIHNADLLALGPLRLEIDVEERDDYGRLLAYVWAGDVFVNQRMVLDGYAWAHNYPPNLTRQAELWEAHDEARANSRGIWAGKGG